MQVEWYGQSAFRLSAGDTTVFIDPFGDMSPLAGSGIQFDYPAIEDVEAHVLLVTHEHMDHNAVEAISGAPTVLRSTAGRLESPIGEIVAVASEHDDVAGIERGPNTIFVFELDGPAGCPLRRFRPGRATRFTGGRDRPSRPGVRPGRRRTDRRRPAGRGARRAAGATLGGADALPHPPHQLPRARRLVPRADGSRTSARHAAVRYGRTSRRRAAARRGARRAVGLIDSPLEDPRRVAEIVLGMGGHRHQPQP